MVMFPVTITPTVLGTVDSTALAIGSYSTGVLVPKAIYIYKPAGDAFMVGADARLNVLDAASNILFSIQLKGLFDSTALVRRLDVLPHNAAFTAVTGAITMVADGTITKGAASPTTEMRIYFDEFPF